MSREAPAVLRTLMACWTLLCAPEVRAQEELLPREEARVLLQALRFDKALEVRGAVRIAVLHGGEPGDAEAMRDALDELALEGIRGVPVSAITVRFVSTSLLIDRFEEEGVTAVYVPEALASALSSIQQVTRGLKLASLTGSRLMVARGVSLGVYRLHGRRRIGVNLRASRVEGMDMSAELLRLAEVFQ